MIFHCCSHIPFKKNPEKECTFYADKQSISFGWSPVRHGHALSSALQLGCPWVLGGSVSSSRGPEVKGTNILGNRANIWLKGANKWLFIDAHTLGTLCWKQGMLFTEKPVRHGQTAAPAAPVATWSDMPSLCFCSLLGVCWWCYSMGHLVAPIIYSCFGCFWK